MKTSLLSIIMILVSVAIMVVPVSAEEVAIDFDGDGLSAGQSIGNAYADLGVTFVGAKVVSTGNGNLGFSPVGDACTINFSPHVTSVSIDFKDDAAIGHMDGFLVNGKRISDSKCTIFWIERTLHIESSTQNPIMNVQLSGDELFPCMRIKFDNLSYNQIPEFPTVALPVAAVLGLIFVFQRRKE